MAPTASAPNALSGVIVASLEPAALRAGRPDPDRPAAPAQSSGHDVVIVGRTSALAGAPRHIGGDPQTATLRTDALPDAARWEEVRGVRPVWLCAGLGRPRAH